MLICVDHESIYVGSRDASLDVLDVVYIPTENVNVLGSYVKDN